MSNNNQLLTAKELATELGVPLRTITTLRQKRAIEFVDLGYRSKFFKLSAVMRCLEKRTIRPRSLRDEPF